MYQNNQDKPHRELLFSLTKKDFVITWYKTHGPGGQKKNKTANACRIQHPESGAIATGQEERSREQNQKNALQRLLNTPKFRMWHAKKCWEVINQKTFEQHVDEMMTPDKIKVEVKDEEGKWVEENKEQNNGNNNQD